MKLIRRGRGLAGSVLVLVLSACGGGSSPQPPPPPPTANLTSNFAAVPAGGTVTLTWTSTNASTCTASGGWSGSRATSGSTQVGPLNAATTVTLTCGTAVSSASIAMAPAPVVTFSAIPVAATTTGTSTLTWSSSDAASCTASGAWSGSRPTSGTQAIGPLTAAATYTLACGTAGVSDTENATVNTAGVIGALLIAPNTQTDSDTNDVVRTPVANNNFDTAQALPNPVVRGGFAALAGLAPTGPLRASGDLDDMYRISLTANQMVELEIATPDLVSNDLDLAIYNSARVLVDASLGAGAFERIRVVTAGDYYIRVNAYVGNSNYILSVGQPTTTSLGTGFTLGDRFAPGEILASFSGEADKNGSGNVAEKTQFAQRHGMTVVGGAPGVFTHLKLTPGRSREMSKVQVESESEVALASELDALKMDTLYAIKELAANPNVVWAEPNYEQEPDAVPQRSALRAAAAARRIAATAGRLERHDGQRERHCRGDRQWRSTAPRVFGTVGLRLRLHRGCDQCGRR